MANAGLVIGKGKQAKGVSILTFAGFCLLQVTGILHGIFQRDMYLLSGMVASFLACGTVTGLAIHYRNR
jgi:MtN3 and saliva related transmembrane protein